MGSDPLPLSGTQFPIVHLFNSIQFIMFNQLFNNTVVRHGHSDCAQFIVANVANGTAVVRYNSGETYKYTNVSRRALIKLIMQPNISLGRWINDALLFVDSKCARLGTTAKYDFNLSAFAAV